MQLTNIINLSPSYDARIKNVKITMAKYKPIDMVKFYQGKICEHSDTYFQKRGRTLCTGRICEQKAAYATAFKNQSKYGTLQGYIFAMEYAKLGA